MELLVRQGLMQEEVRDLVSDLAGCVDRLPANGRVRVVKSRVGVVGEVGGDANILALDDELIELHLDGPFLADLGMGVLDGIPGHYDGHGGVRVVPHRHDMIPVVSFRQRIGRAMTTWDNRLP
jgi:hypothetical protein